MIVFFNEDFLFVFFEQQREKSMCVINNVTEGGREKKVVCLNCCMNRTTLF